MDRRPTLIGSKDRKLDLPLISVIIVVRLNIIFVIVTRRIRPVILVDLCLMLRVEELIRHTWLTAYRKLLIRQIKTRNLILLVIYVMRYPLLMYLNTRKTLKINMNRPLLISSCL